MQYFPRRICEAESAESIWRSDEPPNTDLNVIVLRMEQPA
jgi:hypothetical protein